MFSNIFLMFWVFLNSIYFKYWKSWYDDIYDNCIVEIIEYDVTHIKKSVIYKQSCWELVLAYIGLMKPRLCDKFETNKMDESMSIESRTYYIYAIRCSDGSNYLTHGNFDVYERRKPKSDVRFLSANMLDTDITVFMNDRSGSFNDYNEIHVYEIAIICILDKLIDLKRVNVKSRPELLLDAVLSDDDLSTEIFNDCVSLSKYNQVYKKSPSNEINANDTNDGH